MSSWWAFLAAVMVPLPLALISVLSSPAPREVRKGVLRFVEGVLSFEVRRPFQVMHAAMLATGVSLLLEASRAVSYQQELAGLADKRDPNILVLVLAKKLRAERNAWISAFAFAAWAMLLVTHRVNREKHELRGRLLALQGRAAEAVQEADFLGAASKQEMAALGVGAGPTAGAAGAAGAPAPPPGVGQTLQGPAKKEL